jgi:hypothetical protein
MMHAPAMKGALAPNVAKIGPEINGPITRAKLVLA